jgi:aldose sugar dehydrogenase
MMMRLAMAGLMTGVALMAAVPGFAQATPAGPPVVAFEVPAEPGIARRDWVTGLENPWGIAWLPDGRALVTERSGRLRIVSKDGKAGAPVNGVPAVATVGQGGLLDVSIHPDFARNGWVYLTHSVGTADANMTALSRGKLSGNMLTEVKELFRNPTAKTGGAHFGSRLQWLPDGTLLMSVGDGGNPNIKLNGRISGIRRRTRRPGSARCCVSRRKARR